MRFVWTVIFFFFSRRYNPWWVFACFTILFHNFISLHFSLQFLTFIFFRSSSTWSSHLSLGLPTGLDEHGSHSVSFLTVLVVSIQITCTTQRNLCDFINLTIFFQSLFWAGPYDQVLTKDKFHCPIKMGYPVQNLNDNQSVWSIPMGTL